MTTKLTLTIEKPVIEKAKEYALRTGRSLSDLIESYLENLTNTKVEGLDEMNPELKKLFGVTKISKDVDHKKEIRKILGSKKK